MHVHVYTHISNAMQMCIYIYIQTCACAYMVVRIYTGPVYMYIGWILSMWPSLHSGRQARSKLLLYMAL